LTHAGPLMCGGATVFETLNRYGVLPTERVGIVGIGGLGHLAIQMAAKMGCEVVVFSGSDSKKEEALSLGATEFYATKGVDKLQLKDGKRIHHLLVTTSAPINWNQ
jgi:D-arabinose 1-dehydrogenase-like Zn-dependent alcohol dehydrogenase